MTIFFLLRAVVTLDRFEYCTANLQPNESYLLRSYNIKLYDGDNKTSYENGELILTSHRLIWHLPGTSQYLALYLSYIVYIEEEKSNGFVFSKTKRLNLYLLEPPASRAAGPSSTSSFNYVKLGFKDKLDEDFVSTLRQALQEKKWEVTRSGQVVETKPSIKLRAGIVGIERGIKEKQKATDESISVAFQDLNKLMVMANNMVSLSKNISTKIREKQGDITDDETVKFKTYLLSLGIEDPVTRDAFNDESDYFRKLSHEIAQIIEQPLTEVGGLMALTDVYCRVNRARGLELLSPEDFLRGCNMLHKFNLPVVLRQFDSGVKVLQLVSHSDEVVVESTKNLLRENKFLTAEDLARVVGISVILAKERLTTTEKFGQACRDESIEGLRFYFNRFLEDE